MRAKPGEAARFAELVGSIWTEDSPDELLAVIEGYLCSENSAVFAEYAEGQAVGVALCSLRHDYVEGCDTSPVGYLEGVSVRESFRHRGIARRLLAGCEQWARKRAAASLPATVS